MLRSQQRFYKQKNQIGARLFNGLMKTITRHALQMVVKKYGAARFDILTTDFKSILKPCTGSFTKTVDIPCAHMIKEKLIDSGSMVLLKADFHE